LKKEEKIIAPRTGEAFKVARGEKLKVIDLEGRQVADLLAFSYKDSREMLSTGATIDSNGALYLAQGNFLYSNQYNPLLELIEDTVGAHDLLHPPCSPAMYRAQYGLAEDHRSCYENFRLALSRFGFDESLVPNPFNIFMNTKIYPDGKVEVMEPLSGPGDYVVFEAAMDLIAAVTACAVEESPCNAYRCGPVKVEITN